MSTTRRDLSAYYPAVLTPAQITGDQDNYNPTGLVDAAMLRLSTDAARNITGLATGTDTRTILIHNVGAFSVALSDESGSSSAANRFALAANVTLQPDECVMLQYDGTSSRWRAFRPVAYTTPDIALSMVAPSTSETITAGTSAVIAGPYTIASGTTLTVGSGSTFMVL